MRAVVPSGLGPAENLPLRTVRDPQPGPGRIRNAVRACGVHLIDTMLRSGAALGALPLPDLPHVPGRETAGVMDAVGVLDQAAVTATDAVLVTGAAGGLGTILIEEIVARGAVAVGVAGCAAEVALVAGLGAVAVDYTGPDRAVWSGSVSVVAG